MLLGALVCPGCLIFNPTDFPDPENQYPVILWTDPPGGDVFFIDRTSIEPVVLTLQVFDANEDDVLDARAFVDPVPEESRQGTVTIEKTAKGDPRERTVTVELDRTLFTRGCHVIEVIVADSTQEWPSEREVAPGVGKVTETWFALGHDGDGYEDISLASCAGTDSGPESP